MTAQEKITAKHSSIFAALAAAQAQMGRASKSANNPHFKTRYADLASVMDACMPSLTANGIAVTQPVRREDGEIILYTVFHHSDTGETMTDGGLPLIVGKRDMQGLGSALTYARRYGLMAMAGIAQDDDDGNAAAKSVVEDRPSPAPATISPEQCRELTAKALEASVPVERLCETAKIKSLADLPAEKFPAMLRKLEATIKARQEEEKPPAPALEYPDEILF